MRRERVIAEGVLVLFGGDRALLRRRRPGFILSFLRGLGRSRLHGTGLGRGPRLAGERDAATLQPIDMPGEEPARLLAAARMGPARLIDNLPVERSTNV